MAGGFEISSDTICAKYIEFAKQIGYKFSPNVIVTLKGEVICPLFIPENRHNPTIGQIYKWKQTMYNSVRKRMAVSNFSFQICIRFIDPEGQLSYSRSTDIFLKMGDGITGGRGH